MHIEYGVDRAIGSGLALFFQPPTMIDNSPFFTDQQKYEILRIYNEEVTNLIIAIGMDVEWHTQSYTKVPDEEHYFNMVMGKTAVLPRMMLRMVQAVYNVNLIEALGKTRTLDQSSIAHIKSTEAKVYKKILPYNKFCSYRDWTCGLIWKLATSQMLARRSK